MGGASQVLMFVQQALYPRSRSRQFSAVLPETKSRKADEELLLTFALLINSGNGLHVSFDDCFPYSLTV